MGVGLKEELGCFSVFCSSCAFPLAPAPIYRLRVEVARQLSLSLAGFAAPYALPTTCVPSSLNEIVPVISRYCQFLETAGYSSILACDHNTSLQFMLEAWKMDGVSGLCAHCGCGVSGNPAWVFVSLVPAPVLRITQVRALGSWKMKALPVSFQTKTILRRLSVSAGTIEVSPSVKQPLAPAICPAKAHC